MPGPAASATAGGTAAKLQASDERTDATRGPTGVMETANRSWMLDTLAFHREFEDLLVAVDGVVKVRDRALRIWFSDDPLIRGYLARLPVIGPEEWSRECDDSHLVEWYRVLMAPHLIPTPGLRSPDAVRRGLPELGWHATEARRLARGREFVTLAERHLHPMAVERLLVRFGWGHKGWLDVDDALGGLDRMRRLRPQQFRDRPALVPVLENLFEVLEAAAAKPDHVLISITD